MTPFRLAQRHSVPASTQKRAVVLLVLLVAFGAAAVLSFAVGARAISFNTVLAYLTGSENLGQTDAAVLSQRLVRTLWAAMVGAALALAGAGMQGVTRNPLGDPGILGVNAGASFAVVAGITFFSVQSTSAYAAWAFVGAAIASVLVYSLASLGKGRATPVKLALMGAAISAGLGSLTTALILQNQNALDSLRRWQVGTVAGARLEDLTPGAFLLLIGALILISGAKTINNFALGDDVAASLGENVALKRLLMALAITLLVGTSVALAGPIAFIGLMAPHAVRALVGSDYRALLPLSALFGAVILILADTVGRVILPPQEVQVGVTTVIVGVPVFIYLVRRAKAVNL